MRRLTLLLCVLALLVTPAWAYTRFSAHISTATTTHVVALVAGQTIAVYSGSVCVDGNGVVTNITLQDTAATNLIGTSIVYPLNPGQCLTFARTEREHGPHFVVGSGLGLDVVTSAAGPVEATFEVVQQ